MVLVQEERKSNHHQKKTTIEYVLLFGNRIKMCVFFRRQKSALPFLLARARIESYIEVQSVETASCSLTSRGFT